MFPLTHSISVSGMRPFDAVWLLIWNLLLWYFRVKTTKIFSNTEIAIVVVHTHMSLKILTECPKCVNIILKIWKRSIRLNQELALLEAAYILVNFYEYTIIFFRIYRVLSKLITPETWIKSVCVSRPQWVAWFRRQIILPISHYQLITHKNFINGPSQGLNWCTFNATRCGKL